MRQKSKGTKQMKIQFNKEEVSQMSETSGISEETLRKLIANQKTDEELKASLPEEMYEGLMETCREIDEIRKLIGTEQMICENGLLPDGPICPKCGKERGPSGVDGGSWVHIPRCSHCDEVIVTSTTYWQGKTTQKTYNKDGSFHVCLEPVKLFH